MPLSGPWSLQINALSVQNGMRRDHYGKKILRVVSQEDLVELNGIEPSTS
jgi:hypothetical protein